MPNPNEDLNQDDGAEVGGTLDRLFAEVTLDPDAVANAAAADATPPEKKDDLPATDDTKPKETVEAPAADDPKPKEDAASTDDGLPAKQEDTTTKSRIPGEDTPAVDAPVTTDDPVMKLIEEFKLKDSASPKSKETFENLKRLSAEAVRLEKAATAKLKADLEGKLTVAEKRAAAAASNKLPEDVEKELAELRGFKATFDVENDPEFQKQIEAKVAPRKAANYDSVYSILKSHSLPESELKALKEMSEAERVAAIGELVEKLPRGQSRMKIEAKLMENLNLDEERERAIAEAREKGAKLKQEFRVAPEKLREQTIAAVKAEAEKHRAHSVFKKADITAQTPPEEKKRLEAHNATVEQYTKLYDEAVVDDAPASRAEAAFGLVLAHAFKDQLDSSKATIEKLTKELAEIKKRGNMSDVGKLTNTPADKRPADNMTLDAGDSLDALARQAGII